MINLNLRDPGAVVGKEPVQGVSIKTLTRLGMISFGGVMFFMFTIIGLMVLAADPSRIVLFMTNISTKAPFMYYFWTFVSVVMCTNPMFIASIMVIEDTGETMGKIIYRCLPSGVSMIAIMVLAAATAFEILD